MYLTENVLLNKITSSKKRPTPELMDKNFKEWKTLHNYLTLSEVNFVRLNLTKYILFHSLQIQQDFLLDYCYLSVFSWKFLFLKSIKNPISLDLWSSRKPYRLIYSCKCYSGSGSVLFLLNQFRPDLRSFVLLLQIYSYPKAHAVP